jgi:DNA-binding transcriptional regulator LsrR (DeoR family)
MISEEPQIEDILNQARAASLGLFGLGGTQRGTGIVMDEFASEPDISKLFDDGVVGDISAAFFDSKGRSVKSSISDRIVGLPLEDIMKIPNRIAFAGGPDKLESIAGALAGGIVTSLVTDQNTATTLLNL